MMKESSCYNPKFATYNQEVCKLEDKFDDLELNHVMQRLNEATDALTKASFRQDPILTGVFASDQHHQWVRYKEAETSGVGVGVGNELISPAPEVTLALPT